jgi:hypothetical protein
VLFLVAPKFYFRLFVVAAKRNGGIAATPQNDAAFMKVI